MLTDNDFKEELSIIYIKTIASMCKYSLEEIRKDRDSVDVKIMSRGRLSTDSIKYSVELNVQLKASSRLEENSTNGCFSFELPLKNYDDLRQPTLVPRILCILWLPENIDESVIHDTEKLIILGKLFWLNLKGQEETHNQTHKTVKIPLENIMTCEKLKEIMIKISKEEEI